MRVLSGGHIVKICTGELEAETDLVFVTPTRRPGENVRLYTRKYDPLKRNLVVQLGAKN